jgi:hypothetical protein
MAHESFPNSLVKKSVKFKSSNTSQIYSRQRFSLLLYGYGYYNTSSGKCLEHYAVPRSRKTDRGLSLLRPGC